MAKKRKRKGRIKSRAQRRKFAELLVQGRSSRRFTNGGIVRLAAKNYRSASVRNGGRQSGNPRSDTTS
jgi:hypothetical protein